MGATPDRLLETLRDAQRLGFFGAAPIEQAAAHATGFVAALAPLPDGTLVIDIGSGGGLPGLVLADAFPACSIVLVDRRQKRTDFLARAVARLGFRHVEVRCADVEDIALEVTRGRRPPFDVVTARGFGPPEATLRLARRLLGTSGAIVVSEPPARERWSPNLLAELGLRAERRGNVMRFDVADVSRET